MCFGMGVHRRWQLQLIGPGNEAKMTVVVAICMGASVVWPPHESRESRSLKWYVSLSTGGKPQCGVAI